MAKKEARQQRLQRRRESVFSSIRMSMTAEDLADIEMRGMNTDELLPQYVQETKEVKNAEKRMDRIDKKILGMSPEEQNARESRLAAQKRAALSGEDLYFLSDDAYDSWVAGVLPSIT